MKKTAFIFPGQGAQYKGMGKDLYDNYEVSRHVFEVADSVLGRKISTICFEGSEDELKQTINTQPAIVTTSIAILEVLKSELNITPDYTAGHSLGEYCAMYASGVMTLEDTIKAIQKRAELMGSVKGGSMAAVLNASEEQLKAGLEEGRKYGYVDIANYNSPAQVVITGDEEAVSKAGEYMLANGVRKVVPLPVSGAFHSKYMEEAGAEFSEFIKDFPLKDAKIPVITNVDAEPTINAEDFRAKMPRQIYSSVHWTQTIERLISEGVDTFIEIGPSKILAGLNKKFAYETITYNVYDKISLENTINLINAKMAEV